MILPLEGNRESVRRPQVDLTGIYRECDARELAKW